MNGSLRPSRRAKWIGRASVAAAVLIFGGVLAIRPAQRLAMAQTAAEQLAANGAARPEVRWRIESKGVPVADVSFSEVERDTSGSVLRCRVIVNELGSGKSLSAFGELVENGSPGPLRVSLDAFRVDVYRWPTQPEYIYIEVPGRWTLTTR